MNSEHIKNVIKTTAVMIIPMLVVYEIGYKAGIHECRQEVRKAFVKMNARIFIPKVKKKTES